MDPRERRCLFRDLNGEGPIFEMTLGGLKTGQKKTRIKVAGEGFDAGGNPWGEFQSERVLDPMSR